MISLAGRVRSLRQKLDEIPSDLHDLFERILTRDSDNKLELALCIQWVLFARTPLTLHQLYTAILAGIGDETLLQPAFAPLQSDDIERYILDVSKGMVEKTESSKNPTIQFIHESVRDFFLKDNGLGRVFPELADNFEGNSHQRLKECCQEYIETGGRMEDVSPGVDRPKSTSQESAGLYTSGSISLPFLDYAANNVLYHADEAQEKKIGQRIFLNSFDLVLWTRVVNQFEKHKIRRYSSSVSLLYILAEKDLPNLIQEMSSGSSYLTEESDRYGTPLFAALASDSTRAVKVFLESHSIGDEETERLVRSWSQFIRNKGWRGYFRQSFVFQKKRSVNSHLAEFASSELLDWVIRTGICTPNGRNDDENTLLHYAAKAGHVELARLQVQAGANVNARSGKHNNALYVASLGGHEKIVRLLVDKGADVNAQGGEYGNALYAASLRGHEQIVRLLVNKGADVNAQGGRYGNALYAATSRGHEQIVQLLLDKGADVNAQGGFYGNALQAASSGGHEQTVRLLLDKGANSNVL